MYGVIYKATNLINNKIYIGQTTKSLDVRISKHLMDAKYYNKVMFHRALNKYHENNFSWEIIDYAENAVDLDMKEVYYIKHYRSFVKMEGSHGYNMTQGGYGASGENHPSFGKAVSEETRIKISKSLLKRMETEKSKSSKSVMQFSLVGEYIQTFESMTMAYKNLGISKGHIGTVCKGSGRLYSAHGYIWCFKKDYSEDFIKKRIENYKKSKIAHNRKKVMQIDFQGNLIKIHESTKEAMKSINNKENSGNIIKACLGLIPSAYKYIWIYEEDFNQEEVVKKISCFQK